jgi:hypothetical protein
MAAAALLLALGKNAPIYPLLFRYVPGFGAFQAPARFLYLYTCAVATLAGIGADGFDLSYPTQYVSRLSLAGGVALALLAWVAYTQLPALQTTFPLSTALAGKLQTFTRSTALFGGLLVLSAGVLLLRGRYAGADPRVARSPLPRRWWPILVVGLIAGDLMFFGRRLNPTADPALYHVDTVGGDYVRTQIALEQPFRIFAFKGDTYDTMFETYTRSADFGPTDLSYLRGFRETLLPNLPALEGLESANNYEPLLIAPYADLLETIEQVPLPDALRLLGLMNVRYIISRQPLSDMTPVYVYDDDGDDGDDVHIYANPHVLPRARIVYRARAVPDSDHLLAELANPTFDPATELLLSADDLVLSPPPQSAAHNPQSLARLLRYDSNRVTISAVLPQPGYLVLAQTFYPGWRASVDGLPAQVLRANHAFYAVRLEAGEHQVEFTYRPLSFYLGLAASSLTWVTLAVLGITGRQRVGSSGGQ